MRNKNEEEQSLFAMWRGDMIHDGSAFQFIISRSTTCLFAAGINIAKTSTKAQLSLISASGADVYGVLMILVSFRLCRHDVQGVGVRVKLGDSLLWQHFLYGPPVRNLLLLFVTW